ncbi:MAG: hypothetical protein KY441_09610 [Actinobacteria bacterium]|nr:hypothetical protein [Actinomycetota bacterium]
MAEGTGATVRRFGAGTGGHASGMADSENVKDKAADRGGKLDDKYENAVAGAAEKLDKPTEKLTQLGRRLTGMEEDSDK